MFGLMLLCLPSGHQGGNITIRWPDMDKVWLRTSECQSFAYLYPESLCEVAEVHSGFLWLLVFDLGLDPPLQLPLRGVVQKHMAYYKLPRPLRRWLSEMKEDSKNKCVYHLLHYTYTKANFSFQGLKMQDLDKVQALKALSREFPIEILLAKLEHESRVLYTKKNKDNLGDEDDDGDIEELGVEDGAVVSCGDDFEVELEFQTRVKALVDLDGNLVLKGTTPNGVFLQGNFEHRDKKLKKKERDAVCLHKL